MSAFMVNNRTLTKIAKYMEVCANYRIGTAPGLSEIELDDAFKKRLSDEGLVDEKTGLYSASLIHAFLYRRNREALVARYGQKETDEVLCPHEIEPIGDGGTVVDVAMETRREWLSNLYTVSRCYLYQISEGNYREDEFYWRLDGWIKRMAMALAAYVVDEVRPNVGHGFKPWDEF